MSLRVLSARSGRDGLRVVGGLPRRRRDIQGLRAVAVLVVVAFHAGLPVPGGFVGVDIFFVISGFVITAMLRREWVESGRIRFREFYWRRFKRLTPALAVMVSFTLLASFLVLSPLGTQQTAAKTGVGAMLLGANFVIARTTGGYFDAPAESNPLLNTWSLSVEEQFYLVFPAILVVGWLVARRVRVLRLAPVLLVGIGAVGSFALALVGASGASFPGAGILLGFYSPFTRAWEFAVGGLLALALAKLKAPVPRSGLLGGAGVALLGASLWLIDGNTVFPGPWTLLPVCGALLVIAAGTQDTNPISRMLSTEPMVKVGDWSYSIYLWHWPVIVFAVLIWPDNSAARVIAAALSLAPALASYTWVEQPLRSMRVTQPQRRASLLVFTLLIPIVLAGALWQSSAMAFGSDSVREFQSASAHHEGHTAGCDGTVPLRAATQDSCTWNPKDSGKPIYLVGDSNADHFSEATIAAAKELNRPVSIATSNGCPFVALAFERLRSTEGGDFATMEQPGAWNDQCEAYVAGTAEYLSSAEPGLVIIAASDVYWTDTGFRVGTSDADLSTDDARKTQALGVGLESTVEELERAGHQVMLIQSTPTFEGESDWSPVRCPLASLVSGECHMEMPVAAALARQSRVREVLAAVGQRTGARVWDPWTSLCPGGTCSTSGDGFVRYRDAWHISVPQSVALAPDLSAAIRAR